MYCVYKHTGPTGKVYIGITKRNPQKRWNSGRGYESNRYFFRAIQRKRLVNGREIHTLGRCGR